MLLVAVDISTIILFILNFKQSRFDCGTIGGDMVIDEYDNKERVLVFSYPDIDSKSFVIHRNLHAIIIMYDLRNKRSITIIEKCLEKPKNVRELEKKI